MAVITQDPFTESGDVVLSSHTPNTTGQQWVDFDTPGSITLDVEGSSDSLGTASGSASSTHAIYTSRPNPAYVDVDIQFTVKILQSGSDDPVFCVARATATNNYYSAGTYQAGNAADKKIFKQVAGVKTELASGDSGCAVNDVIMFQVRDATKKLFKNGAEELSSGDNVLTTIGSIGFGAGNAWATSTDDVGTAWRWDDYLATEYPPAAGGSLPPPPPSMLPFLVR